MRTAGAEKECMRKRDRGSERKGETKREGDKQRGRESKTARQRDGRK